MHHQQTCLEIMFLFFSSTHHYVNMGRFQSCKSVVERALRRAFYDGVLELYEGHGSTDTVTAVTLEGTLTLTINKAETLLIRLNEVAQRAEETASDDTVHNPLEKGQVDSKEKEKDSCKSRRKRKQGVEDENEGEKKPVREKEMKIERDDCEVERQRFCAIRVEPNAAACPDTSQSQSHSWQSSYSRLTENTEVRPSCHSATLDTEKIFVKKEPNKSPMRFASPSSPGTSYCRTDVEESTESEGGDPPTTSQERRDLTAPVLVKKGEEEW